MKYSEEPWSLGIKDSCEIFSELSNYIAVTEAIHVSGKEATANAERIVFCVNACAGITNEALEAGVIHSALINFEESLELQKGEQFCFYDIPVLEDA